MNGKDIADELRQIVDLHAAGALSDDEFAAAKAAVLGLPQRRRDPLAREHDTATPSVTARVPRQARSGNRRKVLPLAVVAVVAFMVIVVVVAVWKAPDVATGDAPIGGTIDVWLVGSPNEPSPDAALPVAFSTLLRAHGVTPRVTVISAADFPAKYREAAARDGLPEIMAGRNYLPFESIVDDPAQHIVNAVGPIETLVQDDGFVFLPALAGRHDAATRLATAGDTCLTAPRTVRSTPDKAGVDTATLAIRAILENPNGESSFQSETTIQSAVSRPPAHIDGFRICAAAGDAHVGIVHATASFDATGVVGQRDMTAVMINESGSWKVLGAGFGPPSPQLFDAIDRATSAPQPAGEIQISLNSPSGGQEPSPDQSNYQNFTWTTTGDTASVLAEFLELAAGPNAWYTIPATRNESLSTAHIGNSTFNATVRWRAWAVTSDGRIVLSGSRDYPS